MLSTFTLVLHTETGEINFNGTMPLPIVQQLVQQLITDQAVKEAIEGLTKEEKHDSVEEG